MLTKPPVRPPSETLEADGVPVDGATGKPSLRRRLERLFADYGTVAIATYFGIFFCTWGGFASAIALGVHVDGAATGAGTIGAAWLATKVTQPLRIGATLVLTPVAARVWHRLRPRPAQVLAVSEPPPDPRDHQ
jgi:hypothetical protein